MNIMLNEITKLLQNGEFEKAKQYADKIESTADKHNLLGIIFYQEGKLDDAINHFKKALEFDPTHDDALFNYSKVLFEKENYFESWRYLTRIKNKSWEVYDLLGDTQLRQNNPAMAIHYYGKACEFNPPEQMKQKFEEAKKLFKRNEKLAFFCLPGLDHFIKDIAQILSNIYEVKLVVTTDSRQIQEAYNWADIVWLEWANELAIEITNKLPKAGKKILCRLHSYEALANYPEQINWRNIDKLILVAEHIKDILKVYHTNVYEQIKNKIIVIPNGLDLNKFIFKIRQPGFNIAVVANINHKKDPAMWLQVMGILKKIDERYVLHVAGNFQEIRYANYFKHFVEETSLEKNVKLYGWIEDINTFLEDKNYIISTSIHEGHPYNIAEAMARGIKPIIHNYAGAKTQWPEQLVFNFIDEAIQKITDNVYDSESYRKFIEDKCPLESAINVLTKILHNINLETTNKNISIISEEKYKIILSTSGKPNIRKGGPLGYIANLMEGLKKIDTIKFEFEYVDTNLLNDYLNYNNVDAIHFHSTYDLFNFISKTKKSNYKILLTSHSPTPWHIEACEEGYFKSIIVDGKEINISQKDEFIKNLSKIDILSFEIADYILFASKPSYENYFGYNEELDQILLKKIKENKVIYFWSGVKPLDKKKLKEEIRKSIGIKNGDFLISYVGRHNRIKGFDILKEAGEFLLKKYKDIRFVIAGREFPIKGLEHPCWIEIGWTDEPGSIISASDVFVVPNRKTYFDLAILEALSIGSLVITSNTGGSSEIIKISPGVIGFEPENLEDLIEKILLVKNLPSEEKKKLQQINLETFNKFFTVEKMAQRYLNELSKIF